jgi:anaerobic ribonucleoside-triphosphate reductase
MIKQLKNDKLKRILEERGEIKKEIDLVVADMVKLEKERLKLGYKMDKLKEKTKVIIDQQDFNLGEFEFIATVDLKDGEPSVEILDQIEEYKKMVREDKVKKLNA